MIDLSKTIRLDPASEKVFQDSLAGGLGKLSDARVADSRTAVTLRRQSMALFQTAARSLGSSTARVGVVGYYDPDTRTKVASYRAWQAAADQDLADGLSLLQRAADDPSPNPWIALAAAEFDEAYAELASKRTIGS
ncbi:hypothetical protein ACLQ25_31590 [Micromonospora sp. DT44]|uniref:hypothetical protein n=1 Tax=Micromonospora sp. DT44 TaxID=3393439 RepID=UPI003CF5E0AD